MFSKIPFPIHLFVEHIITNPEPGTQLERRKASIDAEIPPEELQPLIEYLQSRLNSPGPNGKAIIRLIGRMF